MSTDQEGCTGSRWLALLALPILSCAGHAVLLALGMRSLTAVTGASTGRVVLAVVGAALAVVAGVVMLGRTRKR